MRGALSLLSLLPACLDVASTELRSPPPPSLLSLSVGDAMVGGPWTVGVDGATAGASLVLVGSSVGPGAGPCGVAALRGGCFDLLAPRLLAWGIADQAGHMDLALVPPAQAVGDVWVQALEAGDVARSTVLAVRVAGADDDQDGISAADEVLLGTDPTLADSDGDGAADGVEVTRGINPLEPDTDHDGQPDGEDLWPLVASAADPWVAVEADASSPTDELIDPEFDPATGRVVWQTVDGAELWLASVAPATGDFAPFDGRGELVDVDIAPISTGVNGPEWTASASGVEVLYTKSGALGPTLWYAAEGPAGWSPLEMPGATVGTAPFGSQLTPAGSARSTFLLHDGHGREPQPGWRLTEDASSVQMLPPEYWTRDDRWSLAEEGVLVGTADQGGVTQVWRYDTHTSTGGFLTTDAWNKRFAWMISAPEWGGERVIVAAIGTTHAGEEAIGVYREILGTWTQVHTIPTPASMPFVVSPEVFVWQGATYVTFITSTEPRDVGRGARPGLGAVWVAAIDPQRGLVRRISDDTPAHRKDAEPYTGGSAPRVFYTLREGTSHIRRCELGL